MGGWAADYSNPDDFIGVLLSCQAFHPADPDNLNAAELCDPELDLIAQAARTAQATDPACHRGSGNGPTSVPPNRRRG